MQEEKSIWLTTAEAIELTGKSESTVRRLIRANKEDSSKIRKVYDYNNVMAYSINRAFIIEYFKLSHSENNTSNNTDQKHDRGQFNPHGSHTNQDYAQKQYEANPQANALMVLEKQHKDTVDSMLREIMSLKKQCPPLYRHSTFWTALVSLVIIIAVCAIGYLYTQKQSYDHSNDLSEKISSTKQLYQERLSSQKELYKVKFENKDTIIANKDERIKALSKQIDGLKK